VLKVLIDDKNKEVMDDKKVFVLSHYYLVFCFFN